MPCMRLNQLYAPTLGCAAATCLPLPSDYTADQTSCVCRYSAPMQEWGAFLFFAGFVIIMTVFIFFLLPETKGVPIEEM